MILILKDILEIINKDGYISRTQISEKLNIPKESVDEGINHLLRMEYLIKEDTGEGCTTFCVNCPFSKNCSKEVIKTFKISNKGNRYLTK